MEGFSLQKILNAFNYVFWFFGLNIFFLIFNLPLILFFMFIGLEGIITYLPLFLLTLVPLMPSLTVMFYCMGKLIRDKDLDLFHDIFNGLKLNLKQSLLIWCGELILIFILISNIRFFTLYKFNLILTCIFIGLCLLLVAITPYIFVLISRFSIKSYPLIKNSLILAITRPFLSIVNIIILLICFILFEIIPGTTILFIGSIFAFLITFCHKPILELLESNSITVEN